MKGHGSTQHSTEYRVGCGCGCFRVKVAPMVEIRDLFH